MSTHDSSIKAAVGQCWQGHGGAVCWWAVCSAAAGGQDRGAAEWEQTRSSRRKGEQQVGAKTECGARERQPLTAASRADKSSSSSACCACCCATACLRCGAAAICSSVSPATSSRILSTCGFERFEGFEGGGSGGAGQSWSAATACQNQAQRSPSAGPSLLAAQPPRPAHHRPAAPQRRPQAGSAPAPPPRPPCPPPPSRPPARPASSHP